MLNTVTQTANFTGTFVAILVMAFLAYFAWRWIFPLLSERIRIAGSLLFGIQVFLILMSSVTYGSPSGNLWNLDHEYKISSAFTAILLSFVSGAALLAVFVQKQRTQRIYWLLVSLIFAFLALTEYFYRLKEVHYSYLINPVYFNGGALIAVGAVYFHGQATKAKNLWLVLLFGLMLLALGGNVIDEFSFFLKRVENPALGTIHLSFVPLEEALEMFGPLLVLLSTIMISSHLITVRILVRFLSVLIPALLGIYLIYFSNLTASVVLLRVIDLLKDYETPINVQFAENSLELRGYTFPMGKPGFQANELHITVYSNATAPLSEDFGYTFFLIDQQSGEVAAKIDEWSDRAGEDFVVGELYYYRQVFESLVNVPRNRALWLALSLWHQDEAGKFHDYLISASEQPQYSDSHVILSELVLPSSHSRETAMASFANDFALQQVDLPTSHPVDEPLNISFTWSTTRDGAEDWNQFLHFIHEESGYFWNYDQPPLGTRLPTRLWYDGLVDREIWQITLPADLPYGRYQIYTGLYRHSDLARLTVYDDFGDPLPEGRLPLGYIQIESTQEENDD